MASKMISKWNAMSGGGGLSLSGGGADHGSLLGDHHTALGDGDMDEDGKADSLGYNNMLLRPDGTVMTKEHIRELRERQGFCLTCEGEPVKLFSIKKSKLNPLWKGKEPINTIHVSYDGTCLRCSPHLDPHQGSRAPDNARNSMIAGTLHTMIPGGSGPGPSTGPRRRASAGSGPPGSINSMAAAAAAAAASFADALDSPSPSSRPSGPPATKPGTAWSPHRPPQRSMSPRPGSNRTTSDLSASGHSGRGAISLAAKKRDSSHITSSGRLTPPRSDSKGYGIDGRSERSLQRSNSGDNPLSRSEHSGDSLPKANAPKRSSSGDGMLESTEENRTQDFAANGKKTSWDTAFAGFGLKPPRGDVPKIDRDQAVMHAADAFKSQLGGILNNRRKNLERSDSIDSDGFLDEPSQSKMDSTDLGFNNSFMDFGSPTGKSNNTHKSDSGGKNVEEVSTMMNFLDSDVKKTSSACRGDDGFASSAFSMDSVRKDDRRAESVSRASLSGSELDDTIEELKFADDAASSAARRRPDYDTASLQSVQATADWQDEIADDMDLIKGVLSSLAGDATERLAAIEHQMKKMEENQMVLMEQNAAILLLLQANSAAAAAATPRLGSTRTIQQARPMPVPDDIEPPSAVGLYPPLPRGPGAMKPVPIPARAEPSDINPKEKTLVAPPEPSPAESLVVARQESVEVMNMVYPKSPSPAESKEAVQGDDDLLLMSPGVMLSGSTSATTKRSGSRSSSRKKSRQSDAGLPRRSSARRSSSSSSRGDVMVVAENPAAAVPSPKTVEFVRDEETGAEAAGGGGICNPSDGSEPPREWDGVTEEYRGGGGGGADGFYDVEPLQEPSDDENETDVTPARTSHPNDGWTVPPPMDPKRALYENRKQKSTSSNHTETSGESEFSKTNSDPLTDDGGEEYGAEKESIPALSGHSLAESNMSHYDNNGNANVPLQQNNTNNMSSSVDNNDGGVVLRGRPMLGDSDKRESKRKEKKKSGKKDKKEKRSSRKIRADEDADVPAISSAAMFSDFGRIEEN